ncbi:MAG TPA: OmpA family protein [Spirochaetota bacterium]|jgi:outer membrane protein OmpA-like peptidoglycan-associated protein|nr:MAG: Outer membrane porin F precursor [Spirochaetes bacterium ADurb.Bin133]HNZ28101.1 OmpA family protein [Spirochaetota bacterium]HPY88774.1 OmpA family protein [Spirochaetota bacterium]
MASDRNMVSSEDHELNYVLRKWGKKQSIANRNILAGYLKDFKADDAFRPHNRENFYKYIDQKFLKSNLEDSDVTEVADSNDTTAILSGGTSGSNVGDKSSTGTKVLNNADAYDDSKKGKGFLIPIIIIGALILLILLLLLLFGFCKCPAAPVATTTTTTIEKITTTTTVYEKQFTNQTLSREVERYSPIYFVKDKAILLPGEDKKIDMIADYMKNYNSINIKIEGHCAKVGWPKREYNLSVKRAELIKSMIQERFDRVSIETEGFGSEREAVKNPSKSDMAKNRRTEIIIIDSDSDK